MTSSAMADSHLPDSVAGWNAAEDRDPAMAKLRDLTVEYVTAQGGITLEVWRLYMGHWFSTDVMMTIEGVAQELRIPSQLALNIVRSTDAVIVPRWRRTAEFRRSVAGLSSPA